MSGLVKKISNIYNVKEYLIIFGTVCVLVLFIKEDLNRERLLRENVKRNQIALNNASKDLMAGSTSLASSASSCSIKSA